MIWDLICTSQCHLFVFLQLSHWKDHKEECARFEQQMNRAYILGDFPFTFTNEMKHMVPFLQPPSFI